MEQLAVIHAISDKTKHKLLQLLLQHPYCVQALAKKMEISESAVSQQLRALKALNLVQGVKLGYQVHYRVNAPLLGQIVQDFCLGLQQQLAQPVDTSQCACEFSSQCTKSSQHGRNP